MPKTFAFSNKGNHWKTRYSFYPSQYDWVDRTFLSFPPEITNETVIPAGRSHAYRHGYGANCTFYGTPQASAIAITFNDNVSNNKMYRSFSVEGTSNVANNSVNTFTVNNSNVANQATQSVVSTLDERGGIMYGSVGFRNQNSSKNISALGTVTAVEFPPVTTITEDGADVPVTIYVDWLYGAQTNLTPDTQLMFVNANGLATTLSGTVVTLEEGVDPAIGNVNMTVRTVNNSFYGPTFVYGLVTYDFIEGQTLENVNDFLNGQAQLAVGTTLFSISETETNGSMPQGQYADLVITLGNADYEIYALNAYYEPNSLDHSK